VVEKTWVKGRQRGGPKKKPWGGSSNRLWVSGGGKGLEGVANSIHDGGEKGKDCLGPFPRKEGHDDKNQFVGMDPGGFKTREGGHRKENNWVAFGKRAIKKAIVRPSLESW